MSQKVLVAGTGISGISAAKLLLAQGGEVVLYDGNEKLSEEKLKAKFDEGAKREYLVTDSTKESEQMTMYIWDGLFDAATEYLDSITLQDIINHNAVVSGDNYCI